MKSKTQNTFCFRSLRNDEDSSNRNVSPTENFLKSFLFLNSSKSKRFLDDDVGDK